MHNVDESSIFKLLLIVQRTVEGRAELFRSLDKQPIPFQKLRVLGQGPVGRSQWVDEVADFNPATGVQVPDTKASIR